MKVAQRSSEQPQDKTNQQVINHINKYLKDKEYSLSPRIRLRPANGIINYIIRKVLKYLIVDIVLISTKQKTNDTR